MLTQNSLAEKLKSKMIAVQGQDCWLVAKLTSVADCDLKVNKIDLHVNPNFAAQIQRKTQNAQEREQYIRPGESFETVFRMKIGKFDLNKPQRSNTPQQQQGLMDLIQRYFECESLTTDRNRKSPAEFQFRYQSIVKEVTGDNILCVLGVKSPLHFPKVPLHIKCSHPPRAKIGEQIQCEYTIRNLTDDILSVQVRMDDDS